MTRREMLARTGTGCLAAAMGTAGVRMGLEASGGKEAANMAGKVSGDGLGKVWEEHVKKEFVERDVEATLATMTDDTSAAVASQSSQAQCARSPSAQRRTVSSAMAASLWAAAADSAVLHSRIAATRAASLDPRNTPSNIHSMMSCATDRNRRRQ